MNCIDVTNQTELDAALAAAAPSCVHIKSERGVWLRLRDTGRNTVRASDSATVEAYDSATVRASDSATVEAYGSATVEASDSATVRASDSATVEAYGSATVEASDSATVRASDSATVEAYGSATVEAYGSATVRASDSATVRASGSATVRASGSATVRAYGSATVEAYGSATVRASGTSSVHAHYRATVTAGSHVAVHLHSGQGTVTGGVIIDVTQLDLTTPAAWCDHNGLTITDGTVVLYKALEADLTAGREYGKPTVYTVGETVTCDDWADTDDCGGGLHFSPTPHQAAQYCYSATRWLAVEVDVATLRPITGGGTPKAKAPSCRVLREVDAFGREVTPR
ncbi:DUF7666 domain-containing protein [Micromonospora sp. WMMC250]|uniref:DUF7666 domain-containing protein n=1 Tax=Micromonospora sp. WMMC250 TaxID=3014781 RepID=UPI0022B6E099|nr:hypothetical protein [Micromonospora sp. WMMC250]MCZ7376516.1 hypothetical protein [Micromonospora sp. WMMC250]